MDLSCFDLSRLRHHAIRFAPLRLLTERPCHPPWQIAPEILWERHTGACVLDQDGTGPMRRRETSEVAPKIGVLQPRAEHVDDVVVGLNYPPRGADGIVVGIPCHHGDVPTLDDTPGKTLRQAIIVSEPLAPDEIAFERNRPLLIL